VGELLHVVAVHVSVAEGPWVLVPGADVSDGVKIRAARVNAERAWMMRTGRQPGHIQYVIEVIQPVGEVAAIDLTAVTESSRATPVDSEALADALEVEPIVLHGAVAGHWGGGPTGHPGAAVALSVPLPALGDGVLPRLGRWMAIAAESSPGVVVFAWSPFRQSDLLAEPLLGRLDVTAEDSTQLVAALVGKALQPRIAPAVGGALTKIEELVLAANASGDITPDVLTDALRQAREGGRLVRDEKRLLSRQAHDLVNAVPDGLDVGLISVASRQAVEIADRVEDELRALGQSLPAVVSASQTVIQRQIAQDARRQADAAEQLATTERVFQRTTSGLAAVFVGPAVIVSLWGANVLLPGQNTGVGAGALISLSIGVALLTWWWVQRAAAAASAQEHAVASEPPTAASQEPGTVQKPRTHQRPVSVRAAVAGGALVLGAVAAMLAAGRSDPAPSSTTTTTVRTIQLPATTVQLPPRTVTVKAPGSPDNRRTRPAGRAK
jgi:hypothetical protein